MGAGGRKELSWGHGVELGLLQAREGLPHSGCCPSLQRLSCTPKHVRVPVTPAIGPKTPHILTHPIAYQGKEARSGTNSLWPGPVGSRRQTKLPPTPGRAHLSSSSRWASRATLPSTSLQRSV